MKIVCRIFLLAAVVLALNFLSPPRSMAQLDEVEALNKRIIELSQANKFSEAIPLAERVLAIQEKALGPDSSELTKSLNTLAQLYRAQGRIAEAEDIERRVRAQRRFETAAPPSPAPPVARSPAVGAAPSTPTLGLRGGTRGAPPAPGSAASSESSASSAIASPALPDFPWPPPSASTSYVLARTMFKRHNTVGEVAETIVAALERTGYVERSFYRTTDNGVVLVTQLERINDDGTARTESERWPAALDQSRSDLARFLKGLFFVERGRFRRIVFVLQERPFSQSNAQVTGLEAREWIRKGLNTLPPEVANRSYGDSNCTVLIYEFESEGKDKAPKIVDSRLTGRQHLEKAGVMALLERAN